MPRVKTNTAKFDTYTRGAIVDAPHTKSGKRRDRSKPADENDTIFCPKGEKFYTWKFRYGGARRSRTYPKPSQLTQSEFLHRVYEVPENQPDFSDKEELTAWLEETISNLEELRDEQEEKRYNMPESLQESPTGELLQNRYDSLDEWITELEDIKSRSEEELEDLVSEISDYQGE